MDRLAAGASSAAYRRRRRAGDRDARSSRCSEAIADLDAVGPRRCEQCRRDRNSVRRGHAWADDIFFLEQFLHEEADVKAKVGDLVTVEIGVNYVLRLGDKIRNIAHTTM